MKRRGVILSMALALVAPMFARADADSDWQAIEAMDTGSPSGDMNTREAARTAALDYMAKQEVQLRDFEAAHPGDPRVLDAELRLAHLLATRSALIGNAQPLRDANTLLARLANDPNYKDRRADIAFASLSLFMQETGGMDSDRSLAILGRVRRFAEDYPADRRVAALLAEMGELFENQPQTALPLLKKAQDAAADDPMRSRIADDLKRVGMLGKPLEMKWTSVRGQRVDVGKLRGKVVLVYFFATWSAPSMAELDWVRRLAAGYTPDQVQALGVCLDRDPVSATSMLGDHGIGWPVYCDGDGWTGPLVRGFGLNAIPALWIVDRNGVLRSLNAKQEADAMVQRLLNEP